MSLLTEYFGLVLFEIAGAFLGAAKHLNEAATARYFGQLSRESLETRTR
jgi:hypothetical protein